jgi:hypothetical protein
MLTHHSELPTDITDMTAYLKLTLLLKEIAIWKRGL